MTTWRHSGTVGILAALGAILFASCTTTGISSTAQKAQEILNPVSYLEPRNQYGHLGQITVTVPATANVYLAGAPEETVVDYAPEGLRDTVPANSPVTVLREQIRGGETLDIYATGTARHVPHPSVAYGPKGGSAEIAAGPVRNIRPVTGRIGCLVGLFDNQREPFVIGQRKQVLAPRGARCLYLGILDYPGAFSDNQGEYLVTIDAIRR